MTFNTTTYGSEHAESHRLRRTRRRFFAWVAVALAFIVAVGCGAGTTADPGTGTPPPAGADTRPAKPAEKKPAGIGDGQHEVGTDIKVGEYTTTVPADSFGCYWARVNNFDGELQSIISNGNLDPGARGRIVVKKSDQGVEFSGGCTWKRAAK